jgi:hypothetical protein
MAEKIIFTLSDGKEVNFDFSKVTRKEYRALFDASQSNEAGDEVVSRITGLTVEQLDNMIQLDWARLIREIVRRANNPDPT